MNPRKVFGDIDIYVFDQILKERFGAKSKILDAGCGYGRNLVYFLQNDYDVYGVDQTSDAIEHVKKLAKEFNFNISSDNFRVGSTENMPFESDFFDSIISSAVLHFAKDEDHFFKMFDEMWRVLKVGGMFFARLASTIGIEKRVTQISGRRYLIPDGSKRFLVDEEFLLAITEKVGGTLIEPIKTTKIEPIKTTNVQNLRSMTTWVMRKKLSFED
jgi:SAM-dependent methyltransferase